MNVTKKELYDASREYGWISFKFNELNKVACISGDYDYETVFTADYTTDYYDYPEQAIRAWNLKERKSIDRGFR